jgi:predicted N-acyltransferase
VSVHGSEQQQMFFPKLLHSAPVAPVQYHRLLVPSDSG